MKTPPDLMTEESVVIIGCALFVTPLKFVLQLFLCHFSGSLSSPAAVAFPLSQPNRITLYLRSPDCFSLSGEMMQPPAVSKGSRCTCLSVFYQLCSLANGEGDDPRAT